MFRLLLSHKHATIKQIEEFDSIKTLLNSELKSETYVGIILQNSFFNSPKCIVIMLWVTLIPYYARWLVV
jgi:hypothetical protein